MSSLISVPVSLHAQVLFIPTLDLSEIYTDNVTGAAVGEPQERDYITRLAPGLIAQYQGNRTQFNLDYRFEYLIYAEGSDRNTSFNQLQTNLNSELVREYFFLDADASIDQTVIDPTNPVSSNVQITTNRTDVNTAGVSPYLLFPVFSLARSELRYRFQYLDFDDESLSDSTTEQVYFRTTSQQRSRRFSWNIVYDKIRLEFKDDQNGQEREDTSLELIYRTTPNFALLGLGGYEDFSYFNIPGAVDESGDYWEAGFIWDLTRRTSFELRRGERFYGDTYFGRLTSGTRFSTLNISYSEIPTSSAEQFLSSAGVGQQAADEEASEDTDTIPETGLDLQNSSRGNPDPRNLEPNIEKRLALDYNYTKRRNRLILNGYTLERDYLITNALEKEHGGYARIDWQMLPRTVLSLFTNYINQTNETTASTVITRDIGLRATRRISSQSTGYLQYRYFESEEMPADRISDENIVEATLQLTF